jgi:hypothetical protein
MSMYEYMGMVSHIYVLCGQKSAFIIFSEEQCIYFWQDSNLLFCYLFLFNVLFNNSDTVISELLKTVAWMSKQAPEPSNSIYQFGCVH